MFLWVGLHVDQSFISQVFGVNSMGQIDIEMVSNLSIPFGGGGGAVLGNV